MAMTLEYPKTERVASNVSTGDMWRETGKPLFLILFVCMWMTAAAELGPDQWFPTVMGALVPQLQGVLFLVYTAGLMFLLRFYGSGIAHKAPIATLDRLFAVDRSRSVLARRSAAGRQPGRRVRCGDDIRNRQDLFLADDARHHRGAVPARRRAAAVTRGRSRHVVRGRRAADHGRANRSVRTPVRRCSMSPCSASCSPSSSARCSPTSAREAVTGPSSCRLRCDWGSAHAVVERQAHRPAASPGWSSGRCRC